MDPSENQPVNEVSRREFLKWAGIAGGTAIVGAGLGGLAVGCGSEQTATTATAAAVTTSLPQTTSATPSTPVSTSAEAGRAIKLGVVNPITGSMAVLASAEEWAKEIVETAMKDGLVCGDGKNHPINVLLRDSQSNGARAAQVAGDLAMNDGVDILMAGGTAQTCNPAADQAEAMECPFLGVNNIWQTFVFQRGYDLEGKRPMKWTYAMVLGSEQIWYSLVEAIEQVPNNKKVAFLTTNDDMGMAFVDPKTGAPLVFGQYGYELVSPGLYPPGAEDFTDQISQFKKAGCDVLSGAVTTPDFTNFWKQSLQQGFNPTVPTMALAIGMPKVLEALGSPGVNLIGEAGWSPLFPYTDWITGMTCQQLADQFERDTGMQWQPSVGSGLQKYEVVLDAFKRCTNVDDKNSIVEAIKSSKLETIGGACDFTAPVDKNPFEKEGFRPHSNVVKSVCGAHQWVKGSAHLFEAALVSAACFPAAGKPQTAPVVPYAY